MSWIMTIAVGAAIGYFAYQIIQNNRNGEAATGRLHKSTKDRKVAGVCGGIAEYLNTDPTLIRLAFLVICLAAGSGFLAYIAAALILPDASVVEEDDD
jgi:phage shock protein C